MKIEHSTLMNQFLSFWIETRVDGNLRYKTFLDFFRSEWYTATTCDEQNIVLKGRNWEFTAAIVDSPAHLYSLQLVDTKKHAYDYKDKLLERDLGFDTAPVAFEIVAYCSDESDQIVCGRVASKLTEMFGGINLGIRG